MRTPKTFFLLISLLVLTGCTTAKRYSGERPDSEIAVVSLNHAVRIFEMNGKSTLRILQQAGYHFSEGRIMKMLPGDYTARCRLFNAGWKSINDFNFSFSVKAGTHYYMGTTGNGTSQMGICLEERP